MDTSSNLYKLCLCSLCLVIFPLFFSDAQQLQYHFKREAKLDAKLFDAHLLTSYDGVTNTQCMMACLRSRKCIIYIIDLATGYCALHVMIMAVLKLEDSTDTPTAVAYKLSKSTMAQVYYCFLPSFSLSKCPEENDPKK